MATVNLGRIKFVWQGAYSGATAYVADDVVSYNGSSYICILASTGNLPTNTTYWNLMAQTGTDITSIAGLAQGDVLYYNGTAWVRLGAGTSGQFLKTNGTGANPSWSTVTTKLVNVAQTSVNNGVNAGNRYRNPYHWSPLDTSISVTNSSNYFLWTVTVPLSTENHGSGAVEASENNSTWVNAYNKKNLAGDAIVQANGDITWDTSYLGRYPHLVYDRNNTNKNNPSTATASGLYRPTGTPSTLYFRVRFWSENGTEDVCIGGYTPDGGATHGRVALSNMTIYEIAP